MVLPPISSILVSLGGLVAVTTWRLRESKRAVTLKKIIIPPLGMATGFSMFIVPVFRVPWAWAGMAFLIGAVALSIPLVMTTRLERQGDVVMMRRSNAFLAVLFGLAAVRFLARGYFDTILTVQQSAGIFFILAFGMIVRWRGKMLADYRGLATPVAEEATQG
jgi:membrane protein CcdC involved in cytochrome C biogenesis